MYKYTEIVQPGECTPHEVSVLELARGHGAKRRRLCKRAHISADTFPVCMWVEQNECFHRVTNDISIIILTEYDYHFRGLSMITSIHSYS